ncbi:MAG: argininosuccinate lyase, partial [Spirochaetia bacterium]
YRDLQETKEPMMRALDMTLEMLGVVTRTAGSVSVNRERLSGSFTAELLATDEVFSRVQAGTSFRDAYREVAGELESLSKNSTDPAEVIKRRTSTGTPGNLDLEPVRAELGQRRGECESEQARVSEAVAALAGRTISLYSPARDDE